jgi:alginate O-acetyltransferase complex protein AlgF
MILRRTILAAPLLAAIGTMPAFAKGEDGLYDAPPPPNSAFVRVIDASGVGNATVTLGDKSVQLPELAVSGYAIVPAGKLAISFGDQAGEVEPVSGKFYTVVVSPAAPPVLIEDAAIANPAKAGIYFYNFAKDGTATLFAPKQNVAVIADIAAGKNGFRDINAVTLDLEVRSPAGNNLMKDVALQRRTGLTIVAFEGGKVIQTENAVLP